VGMNSLPHSTSHSVSDSRGVIGLCQTESSAAGHFANPVKGSGDKACLTWCHAQHTKAHEGSSVALLCPRKMMPSTSLLLEACCIALVCFHVQQACRWCRLCCVNRVLSCAVLCRQQQGAGTAAAAAGSAGLQDGATPPGGQQQQQQQQQAPRVRIQLPSFRQVNFVQQGFSCG